MATAPALPFALAPPQGVAVDGAGKVYVADTYNHALRQVVVATGAVTTLASIAGRFGSTDGIGPAARFADPQGVTFDGAGNLYVADPGNGTVRKIQLADASVTTVVGVPGQVGVKLEALPAGLNGPAAVATLPTGDLFILDENSVLSVK